MEPREMIEALLGISDEVKGIGDKLKSLSSKSEDLDIVALITSLATDTYDIAVNINEAVDTYKEILEDDMEDLEDVDAEDEELEPADV